MLQQQQTRTNSRGEAYVIGPTGAPLTLKDLPPAETGPWGGRRRAEGGAAVALRPLPPGETGGWVIGRKAEVVAAVRGGLLTIEDALERYRLTSEEFLAWQRSIDPPRLGGPRTTELQ